LQQHSKISSIKEV